MKSTHQRFYYKSNRLQQLRGFCYAAQFGSITQAAEHMKLSQSSVSLQITTLENDFGVKLFERHGPQIILTAQGKKLLDLALPILDSVQNLQETFVQELSSAVRTELHIAANATTKNYLLPPILKQYRITQPEIYTVIHFAEHEEAMNLLQSGEVDIALLPRREHMPFPAECEYIPVFYCTPSLLTLPGHPLEGRSNLTVEEISYYDLTLTAEDMRVIPNLYEVFSPEKTHKKLQIGFVNCESGCEYIEAGLAITVGSDIWVPESKNVMATPLLHLFDMVDYGLVKKREKAMPKKIKTFLDAARNYASMRGTKKPRTSKERIDV